MRLQNNIYWRKGLFMSKVPCTEQAKVELYAMLSSLPISPNKTAKKFKTKTGISFSTL